VDAALAGTARVESLIAQGQAVLPPELDLLREGLQHRRWRLVTVTAHRRENWGEGIENIARAVADLLDAHPDLAVVWPVHGNPAVSDAVQAALGDKSRRLKAG